MQNDVSYSNIIKTVNALKRNSTCEFDFRERMVGVNPYENSMEGLLEQRSEESSDRWRIPPLKGMRYKMAIAVAI